METGTETTFEVGVTFQEIQPYLEQYKLDNQLSNGLLIFLVVYILLKDISSYIKSFIIGGF